MRSQPEISVVVATHNRVSRLGALLESLRAQTIGPERFEIVVVDDASTDPTPHLLSDPATADGLHLRVLRQGFKSGPAVARNAGWRAATGSLVAFTDDDCVADPHWLEEGALVSAERPGVILQGRVDPIPSEQVHLTPLARTIRVHAAGPYYQTCNIFYPRSLLTELGGFDESFTFPAGEDADLAWRAISRGNQTAFAEKARVYHAVNRIGLIGRLRVASRWYESMVIYKRHRELRQAVFTKGIFWKPWHYALFRVLVATMLRKKLWLLWPYLVIPYLRSIELRCRNEGGGAAHALFYPLEDLVEVAAMVRASVRYRMIVL